MIMKPPYCIICGKDKNCDVVYFKKTPEGEEFERRKWVGHPPDCDWFCEDHIEMAKKHQHLTIGEAIGLIKK